MSAKWSFSQQDRSTDINSNPKGRTSALSMISHRCLHACMHSAKLLRKWKVEDRLVDTFRDHRVSKPPEREKGAN